MTTPHLSRRCFVATWAGFGLALVDLTGCGGRGVAAGAAPTSADAVANDRPHDTLAGLL